MRFTNPELCRLIDVACYLPDDEVSQKLITKLHILKNKVGVKPLKFLTIQRHKPKSVVLKMPRKPKSIPMPRQKKPQLPYKIRHRFNPDDGREVF